MLPLFDAGYINIARQYLTIGVNGMVEAAESLGMSITDNEEYLGLFRTYWVLLSTTTRNTAPKR